MSAIGNCAACGAPLRPWAKFCNQCGAAIAPGAAPPSASTPRLHAVVVSLSALASGVRDRLRELRWPSLPAGFDWHRWAPWIAAGAGIVVLAAVLVVVLGSRERSPGIPDAPFKSRTYTHRDPGFSVRVPAGWKLSAQARDGDLDAVALVGDGASLVLTIPRAATGDLRGELARALRGPRQALPGFVVLRSESATVGGRDARRALARYRAATGEPMQFEQMVAEQRGRAYGVRLTAPQSAFDRWRPALEAAAASFEYR